MLKYLLALVFIAVGGAKLVGARRLRTQFQDLGLPPWTRHTIGALEVLGGLGLLSSVWAFWAGLGLALLMVCAVITHLKNKDDWSQALPAIVLLLLVALFLRGL